MLLHAPAKGFFLVPSHGTFKERGPQSRTTDIALGQGREGTALRVADSSEGSNRETHVTPLCQVTGKPAGLPLVCEEALLLVSICLKESFYAQGDLSARAYLPSHQLRKVRNLSNSSAYMRTAWPPSTRTRPTPLLCNPSGRVASPKAPWAELSVSSLLPC